jgi:hypothetical protein
MDAPTQERQKERIAVLAAVGLLHPTMTPFEVELYRLHETVLSDVELTARAWAATGIPESERGEYELDASDYADAFNALPASSRTAIRERILSQDNWQRWAAAHA